MAHDTINGSIPLAPELARQGLRGLEREALRVTPDGHIAQTPHPRALGSALTHPVITTDFSEALPEFVTSPHPGSRDTLAELEEIEAFTARHIGDELLWMTSMPCFIDAPDTIPIAEYGRSNAGRMKHLYRLGLHHRYGRAMQAIAGVHFNYSFPEALWVPLLTQRSQDATRETRDAAWMGLVRNVQRHGWLLAYLFGASPAICPSFMADPPRWLGPLDNGTLAAPYATSLRLSDIGYKNRRQDALTVSTNSLADYIADLTRALATEEPAYAAIGVRAGDEWRQLSAGLLQIENEYYGLVRPKCRPRSGERPTLTLARDGIRYAEVRALDIDPTTPLGIRRETMDFLELFMWFCLLAPSPPLSAGDHLEIDYNQRNVAVRGREPGLQLRRSGQCIDLDTWGLDIVGAMAPLAAHLDQGLDPAPYARTLSDARARLRDPELTPSARALKEIDAMPGGFMAWALERSRRHTETLRVREIDAATLARYRTMAAESLARQSEIEAAPQEPFTDFLAHYYAGI